MNTLLEQLKKMKVDEILRLVVLAKTGNEKIYRNYIPGITKREAKEALQRLIEVGEEGALENRYKPN